MPRLLGERPAEPPRASPVTGVPFAGSAARGGARAGVWWWERPRGAVFDAALALLSGVEAASEMPSFGDRFGVPSWLSVTVGFLMGATLLFRRRNPVALVLLSAATSPTQAGYVLGMVGLYSLGAYCPDRRTVLGVGGISLAASVVTTYVLNPTRLEGDRGLLVWQKALVIGLMTAGAVATPVLLGLYMGTRRRLVAGLQERTRTLELEQRLLSERAAQRTERARAEERSRIAREMHDVVAHRVSLMVVHAGAIQAVAGRDEEAAARSAALVGDIGRQALNELREILGVLRSGPGPAPGGDTGEAQPVLADLDGLVAQSRAAGMGVVLAVEGEPRRLAAELEGTAYRIVQEGLTNAHKHAGGAEVRVCVEYGDGKVAVSVENGPPGAGPGGGAGAALPSGGNGLMGMRERVEGLAGTCTFGGTAGGGFRVHAVLPTV